MSDNPLFFVLLFITIVVLFFLYDWYLGFGWLTDTIRLKRIEKKEKKAGKMMKAANQAKEPRKPKKKKEKPFEYIGEPFDTLKEFYDRECSKIEKDTPGLVKRIKDAVKEYKLDDLLFLMTDVKQLRCAHRQLPNLLNFLNESNLFYMGDDLNGPLITFGADPEFILCDIEDEDKIVLFSSKHRMPSSSNNGRVAMSSLAVGGDYGLLELRPDPEETPKALVGSIRKLVKEFEDLHREVAEFEYDDDEDEGPISEQSLKIKETEAVEFNHKRKRIQEKIADQDIDFGTSGRDKIGGTSAASLGDASLAIAEYYGVSLTAYNKPVYVQMDYNLLTAGGHLHFGGKIVKMLSITQLKALIRKFDEKLMPMAAAVETPAADLRRKCYGLPGEFRLKDYGFEYRVLSCAPFWPKNSKVLRQIIKEARKTILGLKF